MLQSLPTATHSFWDFNIGNLLTVSGVLIAWVASRWQDSKTNSAAAAILEQRIRLMEKWQEKHDGEADKRDDQIQELREISVKLSTLAETAEQRLNAIERRYPQRGG